MDMASWWKTAVGLIVVLVPLVSSQVFLTEPRDAEVLMNAPMTMPCSISSTTQATVYWEVPGSVNRLYVEPNQQLPAGTPARFSIGGQDGTGNYNLNISRVQIEDEGMYTCNVIVDDGRGDIQPETLTSQSAILTVIRVPPIGDPVCWIREGRLVEVGDDLSLMCASSDPTVELKWYLGDVPLSSSNFETYSPGPGIRYSILAESSVNQRTFTCQPNKGQYEACQVTVVVRHSPIVTIEADAMMETGIDATFTCTAIGNPPDFAYTWHYNEYQISFAQHPRFNRARLEKSGSVLILPDLTDSDNNATLRCEAVNDVGEATASHVIRALPGKTLAQIIGPILLGIILGLVLIVLLLYAIWWRRQRRKVKQINKKKSVKRSFSLRNRAQEDVPTVDSGIVYTQTRGGFGSRYGKTATSNGDLARSGLDLESAGYGPDVTSIPAYRATAEEEREDDGALRPIPRKTSMSSLASGARGQSTTADDASLISPNEEKSFTYYVNPHFDEYRNSMVKIETEENNLDPEMEEEKHAPPPYNIGEDSPELKPSNDVKDENIISTEL
ncbi:kin of IRRE-like protein 2 [Patiria miniata]|uniref:Ig-like domain-containing protein n=1 Tax=Patiria miniata TaxID=46514 RepID=A0A914BRW9_PATMI|nr:kin of IRRE-like protein 2 [Patiria miniata]